ncbi:class I SAM-dependent methyltransferase [Nocardioides sp.]|uniref:class I SAM-dependent methyltransferase n=1 Tax=Nocardioides sp. TaxID=35761 RepID=UPI002720E5C2|nr:class I SAM-dependent methyltransferase [Nocardioides sp.]MDO9455379.1 class I SAM-dependent methyltransferase [Nocardioides sp.]
MSRDGHPFASRWNHNSHYYPLIAARLPASGRVLDVGCGEGTFCRFIAAEARTVVGVDPDASVLPPPTGGVRYVRGSAESLPFVDAAFDALTMTMVLHHVEPGRGLAEAARVLAPGGRLLVLGFGRRGGRQDLLHELRDAVTHRVVSRRMQPWDPPTVKSFTVGTWAEVRESASRALPGCTYSRLPMWRYLVEWHKPVTP